MPIFNYKNLSSYDFEVLALDIMQRILGVNLYRYAPGRDGGIDLCDDIRTHNIVVQCKRFSQFSDLKRILKTEKIKLDNLNPRPNKYYVFTSLALTTTQKKQVLDIFGAYMPSEDRIIDQITIEDFFRDEKNHDLVSRHLGLFVSYPANYIPDKTIQTSPTAQLMSIAAEKRKQILLDLLFPWFPDSAQYYEVFPKLFISPRLKNNKTHKYVQSVAPFIHKNIFILGGAGAGKTTFLKIIFSYKTVQYVNAKDTICLYYHANDYYDGELQSSLKLAKNDSMNHYLFLIDGIDETFNNRLHDEYCNFIQLIKTIPNCSYWLGCREDFYKAHIEERTQISDCNLMIDEWTDKMINTFIRVYSKKRNNAGLPSTINAIIRQAHDSSDIIKMMHNPFQLSILTFLAEECCNSRKEKDKLAIVQGVYDLYEQFLLFWIRHEKARGTSPDSEEIISEELHKAAREIYGDSNYVLVASAPHNSAVTGLLKIKQKQINGTVIYDQFYHRSIAEFLMANEVFGAIYDNDSKAFTHICRIKLKDDITNYICDKFTHLDIQERRLIKRNLWSIYNETGDSNEWLSIREQIIYFITRLEIDVSDFIKEVQPYAATNTMIKMTLAYGCALQEDAETRKYALNYARAIVEYPQGDEAVVNRAWAVIYYGDIHSGDLDINEYQYRDTIKGSWDKVRKSRTDRFQRQPLRRKDARFLILDISLFHNFLIDRNWDHISSEEYHIIEGIPVDNTIYIDEEYKFIISEKARLLKEYDKHLSDL